MSNTDTQRQASTLRERLDAAVATPAEPGPLGAELQAKLEGQSSQQRKQAVLERAAVNQARAQLLLEARPRPWPCQQLSQQERQQLEALGLQALVPPAEPVKLDPQAVLAHTARVLERARQVLEPKMPDPPMSTSQMRARLDAKLRYSPEQWTMWEMVALSQESMELAFENCDQAQEVLLRC